MNAENEEININFCSQDLHLISHELFNASETQFDFNSLDQNTTIMQSTMENTSYGIDVKGPSHLSRFPDIDEIKSDYNFEVVIPPDNNSNCVYMHPKLFIKMNSTMTLQVSYKPQRPSTQPREQLYLRAMIIFTSSSDMHLPVKRCANHRIHNNIYAGESADMTQKVAQSHNILKIEHPAAHYHGKEDGQTFGERLSIVIPIDSELFDDEKQRVTNSIRLEFGCQNSCSSGINRKATAIVFTLEKHDFHLVGKSAIQFKVCSCPKRDADREQPPTKRKNGGTEAFPRGKLPKFESPTQLHASQVKIEPAEEEHSNGAAENSNMFSSTEIKINIPTKLIPDLLKQAYQIVAGEMAFNKNVPHDKYMACLRHIEDLQRPFEKRN